MKEQPHTHVWRITGLDCPVCAKELERTIQAREGIVSAEVDFVSGVLKVLCRLEEDCERSIIALLQEHGADLRTPTPDPKQVPVSGEHEHHHDSEHEPEHSKPRSKPAGMRAAMSWWSSELGTMSIAGLFMAGGMLGKTPALFLGAMLVAGIPVFLRACRDLGRREVSMHVLMTSASLGALWLDELEEGAMVLVLFAISRWLEKVSSERARASIEALRLELPAQAHLISPSSEVTDVPLAEIPPGSLIRIKPHERIPLDALVVSGHSWADESTLSGESRPIEKSPGSPLLAGTWNQEGTLDARTTAFSHESQFSRIMLSVEKAQSQKTRRQSSIERFALWYTPLVIVLAALTAILPPLFWGAAWGAWFYTALVLLVIACPCALVLAAPIALVSSMATAARSGVLVRNGDALETAADITTIAMDKTGTLTRGTPRLLEIVPCGAHTRAEVVTLCAALEDFSDHPLARAFRQEAEKNPQRPIKVEDFRATRGKGIEGRIDGRLYRFGTPGWSGPSVEGTFAAPKLSTAPCASVSLLSDGVEPLGFVLFGDEFRPETGAVIESLKQMGMTRLVLLSGDRRETAEEFGRAAGMTGFFGGLTPEDKAQYLRAVPDAERPVLMLGDGINDTPALATADLGVAMGDRGSDAVLETAGAVLLRDDLTRLPVLLQIARRCRRLILQNIALAVLLKLAVFAFSLAGKSTLWMAVLADTGASLLVVLNGLRALAPPESLPGRQFPAT
jgi:Cd2+/Zn2+-exporting ATPase